MRLSGTEESYPSLPTVGPDGGIPYHKDSCYVCFDGDVTDGNEIVYCDNCNMAVHQGCYGIKEVPQNEWFCNPCSWKIRHKKHHVRLKCCICEFEGGALKPVDDKKRWAHVTCAQVLPETSFGDYDLAEPILIGDIDKKRLALKCYICTKAGRASKGACTQCSYGRCAQAMHPLCCFSNNLAKLDVHGGKWDWKCYCEKHQNSVKEIDEEEAAAIDAATYAIFESVEPESQSLGKSSKRRGVKGLDELVFPGANGTTSESIEKPTNESHIIVFDFFCNTLSPQNDLDAKSQWEKLQPETRDNIVQNFTTALKRYEVDKKRLEELRNKPPVAPSISESQKKTQKKIRKPTSNPSTTKKKMPSGVVLDDDWSEHVFNGEDLPTADEDMYKDVSEVTVWNPETWFFADGVDTSDRTKPSTLQLWKQIVPAYFALVSSEQGADLIRSISKNDPGLQIPGKALPSLTSRVSLCPHFGNRVEPVHLNLVMLPGTSSAVKNSPVGGAFCDSCLQSVARDIVDDESWKLCTGESGVKDAFFVITPALEGGCPSSVETLQVPLKATIHNLIFQESLTSALDTFLPHTEQLAHLISCIE